MKIYTRTGDKGQTSLIGGRRVSKADHRINAYGTVDELNSWIGLVRDQPVNAFRRALLKEIQDRLFTIGATLATDPERAPKKAMPDILPDDVTRLERAMDDMDAELPELRKFVLPGGHPSVSYAHLARTVCRRTERLVIDLSQESVVDELLIQYLNRLSDYLFVLSRKMALELEAEEVSWEPRLTVDPKISCSDNFITGLTRWRRKNCTFAFGLFYPGIFITLTHHDDGCITN